MPDSKEQLSEEDRKILEEYHRNSKDPGHPAHHEHKEHGQFLKSIPKKFLNAGIWGAGATAGSDMINSLFN